MAGPACQIRVSEGPACRVRSRRLDHPFRFTGTTGVLLRIFGRRDPLVRSAFRRDALVASAPEGWIIHFDSRARQACSSSFASRRDLLVRSTRYWPGDTALLCVEPLIGRHFIGRSFLKTALLPDSGWETALFRRGNYQ